MASLIVIGAGPGGYETAAAAAARGMDVTLVTAGPLGGTCLNEGCIPTKTFCAAAQNGLSGCKEAVRERGYCSEAAISAKPGFSGCKEAVSERGYCSEAAISAKPEFSGCKEAVSEGGYCSEAAISAKPEFSGCKEHVSSEQASEVQSEQTGRDIQRVVERKNEVIAQLRKGIEFQLKKVRIIYAKASFIGPKTIQAGDETLTADNIIIATGSSASVLPIPGAELCVTSTEMLELQEIPERLCVIGGGVIGLEFASIFASFGSEVTVIEYCPQILPRFDTDLSKHLKSTLAKRGIKILNSASVSAVRETEEGLEVAYSLKEKASSVIADKVLMAVGRKAYTEGLELDAAGIQQDRKGIVVDDGLRTNIPGVYAIGDVTGGIMLAHVAKYQGLKVLDEIDERKNLTDFNIIPSAVFTFPEVGTVGRTEEECVAEGIQYEVRKSFYRANGKAVSMGEQDGYCKVLVSKETGLVLGAHIMGAHASDLIHEAALIMASGMTIDKAGSVIFAHPTLSEVLASVLN